MNLEIGKTVYRIKDGAAMKVAAQGALINGALRSWACYWLDPQTGVEKEDIFRENELTEESPSVH